MAPTVANAMREEKVEGAGGLALRIRSWRPGGAARAAVMIVPGFNAHSGQYGWVADQWATSGFAVYGVDLRGRGESDGERFYVESVSDYVADVRTMAGIVKQREPGLPVFLFGHSAGGVVACLYALEYQSELTGLICEDFAFQVPAPDFALAVLKGLSHVAPHAHVFKLDNKDFSRDPRAVQSMNDDPLIAHEVQPTQTMAAMVRADERLKREFPLLRLPVFILHGTNDKVTKPSGSQAFHDTVGAKDKTLKLYDGFYHDPLHDLGKEQVLGDITSWMSARIPG